jgi:ActR/RegA family two-component response regulator
MKSDMRTLLMVDDDEAFRKALKDEIDRNGKYVVHSADSGEAALEALKHEHFDVVILDYRMLGLSGLNVLQWMNEQRMDTPVVMMTVAGSETVAVEAMKLGAYDYVRKDQIDIDHIGILIDGVVERYLFRREKVLRDAIEHEHKMNLVGIETYHSTLASIAQIVNSSLSMVSLTIRKYESTLKPYVTDEGRQRFSRVFSELKQEYGVVASTVKAMLDMANVLHGNFTDIDYEEKMQELMNGSLQAIQELEASNSSGEKLDEKQQG